MNDTLGSYFVPRTDGRHCRRYYTEPAWSYADTAAIIAFVWVGLRGDA